MTWGSSNGGDSSSVASKLDGTIDVVQIFSTGSAFAALREDGSVVTWVLSALVVMVVFIQVLSRVQVLM